MKNNRGSLTITALFTVLIFSLYGILLYARSASSYIRQTKSIETIQAIYAQDVPNAARIAEQLGATSSEILKDGEMIVTFNANGGTLDIKSKKVRYGEEYGDLPVPTREGYTFKGWNGKNMLNLKVDSQAPSDTSFSKTTKRTFSPNSYVKGLADNNYYSPGAVSSLLITGNSINFVARAGYGVGFPFVTEANKKYKLSYDVTSDSNAVFQGGAAFYQVDGTFITFYRDKTSNGTVNKEIETPEGTKYMVILFIENITNSGVQNPNAIVTSIQLEEGNVATEYEPYYITPSTKVVQQNNHILTAIWEKN